MKRGSAKDHFFPHGKKAQTETYAWLIDILKGILEVVLVLAIVIGMIAIIWNATKKTPQDQDFKRVLDATKKLIDDFEEGKIQSRAYYTVPIVSPEKLEIYFFPEKGLEPPPPRCGGRTCFCMFQLIGDNLKETCRIVDTKPECKLETCGEELCPGSYKHFTLEKGDDITVSIDCTPKGSKLSIEKS